MNILIVGCGGTGAQLANSLFKQGHAVSVVDKNEASFERLDANFAGMLTVGVPIDVSVLKKAGIEQCDAVVAVTSDDNINAMVAQMAKEILKVDKVLARIQDPLRSGVFASLGFDTISTTSLVVNEIEARLMEASVDDGLRQSFERSRFKFIALKTNEKHTNLDYLKLRYEEERQLIGIAHNDGSILLLKDIGKYKLKPNDRLLFLQTLE